ncbi:hypothetical protein [Aquifex aeolicus]|uniref:Uncharacterized protein n=1 Tax=Aquifex aeolicus (strain VF5) TaxID=224324 RepID=O66526_AQUAE|nr:hypothetical protein [Aquifex aeolicus]AAC06498.1 putative protein [Aquifex aeolicus VF5]
MNVKEGVKELILSYGKNLAELEPINTKLIEYKLKLKAQIIKTLSLDVDKSTKEEMFKDMLEGVNEAVAEIAKEMDTQNERMIERYMLFFESTSEVLKEFMEGDYIEDKHELSQTLGKISKILEKLRLDLKEKQKGILKFIRRLIFRT